MALPQLSGIDFCPPVRQALLASSRVRALNVTTNYVSQLERGAKRPRGATLDLLSLIKSKWLDRAPRTMEPSAWSGQRTVQEQLAPSIVVQYNDGHGAIVRGDYFG